VPPLEEQEAIVRFLDWANGRLERVIRGKRRVIALLTEQKQAIIHRAVTRGLDPSVPLKPSGIPWLGDIPAHWEAWRVGQFAKVGNGSTPSRSRPAYWEEGTFPWLNSSHMKRGQIDSSDQFVSPLALAECHLPIVKPGSVLVAITGQGKTRGTAAVLRFEATVNQHVAYISPRSGVVSTDFLQTAFLAAYSQLRAISDDSGSTKGAITCADIKRFPIPVPPKDEQQSIVAACRALTSSLDLTKTRLVRELLLLEEYRIRLTADVVTGKLDVREAAKNLPVELEIDLVDDTTGDDELEIDDEEAVA
jgi:type I restriction enzyme, S subunit